MSRDRSPEICGWCGVELPCDCGEREKWTDQRADPLRDIAAARAFIAAMSTRHTAPVFVAPAHDAPEDLGGFYDMDGDEADDREPDPDRETETVLNRGTSACDGSCAPMCDWCLVSHACPDDCGGECGDGLCPYVALGKKEGEA